MKHLNYSVAAVVATLLLTMTNTLQAQDRGQLLTTAAYAKVNHLSGGIGEQSRDQMRTQSSAYNLRVSFTETTGEYLLVDSVSVSARGTQVLSLGETGPLLFANLPRGNYIVQATYMGVTRSKAVNLDAGSAEFVMTWPSGAR